MKPRVLLAGLFHETHTFLEERTRAADFSMLRGNELLDALAGSPLSSAVARGLEYGWEWLPTVDYRAQPSGTVADDVFEQFWREFRERAAAPLAAGVDAIFLVLHGAMVTESLADVEGEFLQRLRALSGAGEVPIYGVFDLHANFTQRMASFANCLVAYRENPHADACARATHAADLLQMALQAGQRPRTFWQHAGIVWPPSGTGTSDSPLRELEALARACETQPNIVAVNVCGGFAFADTPDTGVSFSVVSTGPEAEAHGILATLCAQTWELREAGVKRDPNVDEVLRQLPLPGLTVIAEPADNIGGGAPGDGTGLLRAFIAHQIQQAAICLCDPVAVQELQHHLPGDSVRLTLGGRGSSLDAGPLGLEVELVSRRDGRFRLADPQSHLASMFGGEFDMGSCAVVRHAGVTILLTSRKTPPFDLGQWRSQGLEPTEFAVIGVKAAVAHRRAYEPIAARMWSVDTPGPCRSDLGMFPYQHLRRPIFPLDIPPPSPNIPNRP